MNYEKHYNLLINRAKNRILEGYVERHHILPRCMGGTDDASNLVQLTPEEHYVAHQLLIKMHPTVCGLAHAAQLMTVHHTDSRTTNKLFGWIRKRCAISASEKMKKWLEDNEHPKGMLGKKHTEDIKEQIRMSSKIAVTEAIGVRVYAYNLDGSFYKEFRTLSDCADHLGTNTSNVKYTAEGRFAYCKRKQLKYEYTESIPAYVKPTHPLTGKKKSDEHVENMKIVMNKKYTCTHCGHVSNKSSITRFHNDKCKIIKERNNDINTKHG